MTWGGGDGGLRGRKGGVAGIRSGWIDFSLQRCARGFGSADAASSGTGCAGPCTGALPYPREHCKRSIGHPAAVEEAIITLLSREIDKLEPDPDCSIRDVEPVEPTLPRAMEWTC